MIRLRRDKHAIHSAPISQPERGDELHRRGYALFICEGWQRFLQRSRLSQKGCASSAVKWIGVERPDVPDNLSKLGSPFSKGCRRGG